jgi:hypothetical protein
VPLPYPKSSIDANQCIQFAFDMDTGRLRTDSTFSGSISINLTSTTDNVAIGDSITGDKLTVNADGSINVNVAVSHLNDSIRLGDGTSLLTSTLVSGKQGLDVNLINTLSATVSGEVDAVLTGLNEYTYNETTIAAGATTTVVSQLFATAYKLRRVRGSGENIGRFFLKFNGVGVDKILTTYTDFNSLMDYETGIDIPAGTTVTLEVTNVSTTPGVYSAQLLYSIK